MYSISLIKCTSLFAVVLLAINPSAYAATVSWTGNDQVHPNDWSAPSNWDGPVRVNSDILIDPGTVYLDALGNTTVRSLQIGSQGSLTINSGSTLISGGSAAPALLNAGSVDISSGGKLVLDVGGALADNSSGTISVSDGGTLSLRGTGDYSIGTTTVGSGADGATLQILGNASLQGETQTLRLSDSSTNLITGLTGSENLSNSVTIAGGGSIQHLGSFTNNGMLMADASNPLVVNTLTNWAAGTLTGGAYEADGVLQISPMGGAGSINTLSMASVTVNGTGLITGDGTSNALAGLTNISNSDILLSGQPGLTITPTSGVPGAKGTLRVTADDSGTGVASLTLDASSVTVNGNLSNGPSGTLQNFSAIAVQNGSTLTVNGNFSQDSGLNGGAATIIAGSSMFVTGDTLQNAASLVFTNGSIAGFGALHNRDSNGNGSFLWVDGSSVSTGALQNDAGSQVQVVGGGQLVTGAFTNDGEVTVCGCSTNQLTVSTGDFTNHDAGRVEIGEGSTLTVASGTYIQTEGVQAETVLGGTLDANVVISGGILTGIGTITGDLDNDSADNPGDEENLDGPLPGTQTIKGNYRQGDSGFLVIDAEGADFSMDEYDNLMIGGDVFLSGELDIDLLSGYVPALGDTFRILSWGGHLTGDFTSFGYPELANGLLFQENIHEGFLEITVVDSPSVPEPSTLLMAFFPTILLGAGLRRRGRVKRVS